MYEGNEDNYVGVGSALTIRVTCASTACAGTTLIAVTWFSQLTVTDNQGAKWRRSQ